MRRTKKEHLLPLGRREKSNEQVLIVVMKSRRSTGECSITIFG